MVHNVQLGSVITQSTIPRYCIQSETKRYIDGLVLDCNNSSALAIELVTTVLHYTIDIIRCDLNPRKTPHVSPSSAGFVVSAMRLLEKIDRVLMEPYCIYLVWLVVILFIHHHVSSILRQNIFVFHVQKYCYFSKRTSRKSCYSNNLAKHRNCMAFWRATQRHYK